MIGQRALFHGSHHLQIIIILMLNHFHVKTALSPEYGKYCYNHHHHVIGFEYAVVVGGYGPQVCVSAVIVTITCTKKNYNEVQCSTMQYNAIPGIVIVTIKPPAPKNAPRLELRNGCI